MVQRRQRERSLFEVLLPDGHKLWPDWLRKIDTLLEDEAVIEVVAQALEARWPQSRRRGRPGTPAEVVIRMLILKHLFDWSYDDLEREVRANLVYRMFTRIDAGDVPDAKTILKIARALGPEVIEQLHRQVVEVAKRAGVTHGRRFRIDTTVVETNVHYPTDSTLLRDGMRVLTRTMQRASAALGDPSGRIRNRLRSVTRRVLIIGYEARSPKTRDAMVKSYRKLMATTRAVLRDTATMVRRLGQRVRTASPQVQPILQRAQEQLQADAAARAAGRRSNAGARPGRRHPRPRQSPEHLRTAHRDDSQRQDREAERVRQAGDHSRIGTSDHHGLRRPREATGRRHVVDRGAWIGIRRSSAARRIWPPAIAASARRPTNRRRRTAASAAWSCRGAARSRPRGAPTNANAGSVAGNAGASAAKAGSVCSNADTDSTAVATMATTACTAGSGSASSRTI